MAQRKRKMKILLKFIFASIIVLTFSKSIYGVDIIQPHHPIYFTSGDKENQVKYEISFKCGLWYPFDSGLFLAYRQLAKWDIYDRSSPFKEIDHNPSIFWEKENLLCSDFIRLIPYSHQSNGRDGQESRSMDRYFIEAQYSIGDKFNLGIREKAGAYYAISNKNKDIDHYIGYFETELFFQIRSKYGFLEHERLYAKGEWVHNRLNTKYWFECGLTIRLFTARIQPDLYVQFYNGYAEFMEDYNKKTNALRAGFIFNTN
jgi:phospholipase A1